MSDLSPGDETDESDGPEYDIDFRERPEAYEVGRGEQGAFKVQPYKDELLPLWEVKTLDGAETAARELFERFRAYRDEDDFVGMDMARKYLQMGWTRSLRYAKYPGGRKYDDDGAEREPQQWYDEEKYEISQVYRAFLDRVESDDTYTERRAEWTERHG
ncbi:DUF4385 domain-containing protein [Salinigranum rubrum]|uniref:DUF4385 domain-containing protein n=1 Tax=Salinigranum rubrum TaxID=755307 RepID=A0A2I8VP44_9EURY|nr:DUF4385 family protein [Salinigranum rubrum]AUV83701.1 DUF4385 domain-containing protein [Salinigranum rubrum]